MATKNPKATKNPRKPGFANVGRKLIQINTSRPVNTIVVHHSHTKPGTKWDAKRIDEMHKNEKKLDGIGYHAVILRDGTIQRGRDLNIQGAHVLGKNKNKIGICLLGGKDTRKKDAGGKDPKEADPNFSYLQYKSLVSLIRRIQAAYKKVNPEVEIEVVGHRDLAKTKCPGFDVRRFWEHN